jgi:hypothetical protein
MSTAFTVANIQYLLTGLKEKIEPSKWSSTPLPVIFAPTEWLEQVRTDLGMEEGLEPAEIYGCAVIKKDELAEPMLVDHDGKIYPILSDWVKEKEVQAN